MKFCKVLALNTPISFHDKDTWDEDGEDKQGNKHKAGDTKKPHYHILAGWDKGISRLGKRSKRLLIPAVLSL